MGKIYLPLTLGYTLLAIIAEKCRISYNQALNTISGMREVVYSSGAHAPVEYTKKQREILEKLKSNLQCYKWAKMGRMSICIARLP